MTSPARRTDLGAGDGGWVALAAADAELAYLPALLTPEDAALAMTALTTAVQWEQHTVRIAGRRLACPRLSAWYGDPGARYAYSGLALEPSPWPAPVARLRELVESRIDAPFDSVLLNLYRDGADSMGWHSDDEPELGPTPLIASVSLGATRRFVLRHRRRRDVAAVEIALAPGSLLVMSGPTQRAWRHALPKTRRPVGPRINLTFRQVLETTRAVRTQSPG